MSRKPIKNKSTKRSSPANHNVPKKQWTLKPLKQWVTGVSEKVLDGYALPLTRLTEAKIRDLKIRLKAAQV